jgi:hypothetical protein
MNEGSLQERECDNGVFQGGSNLLSGGHDKAAWNLHVAGGPRTRFPRLFFVSQWM